MHHRPRQRRQKARGEERCVTHRATFSHDARRKRAADARRHEQPREHGHERVGRVPEHDVHALHERHLREHEPGAERRKIDDRGAPGQRRLAIARGPQKGRTKQDDRDERARQSSQCELDRGGHVTGEHPSLVAVVSAQDRHRM